MSVLIAPDKFKGTASAGEVAAALSRGLRSGGYRGRIEVLPVSDGGDGFVDAFAEQGFTRRRVVVTDANGDPITATYAVRNRTGVIEAAQACGLGGRVPTPEQAVQATSFGVGELILEAIDQGCDSLIVGLGGTASSDGGQGMVEALSVPTERWSPEGSEPVGPFGELDSRLRGVSVTVATDVDNPLLGPRGAAQVFGPQKGANAAEVVEIEQRLETLARVWEPAGVRLAHLAGTGAGGGLGYALMHLLHADRVRGAELVLAMADIAARLENATLVITGEGMLDATSLDGKAAVEVAGAAGRVGVPVIAVVGQNRLTDAQRLAAGFAEVHDLVSLAGSPALAMESTIPLLEGAGALIAGHERGGWKSAAVT